MNLFLNTFFKPAFSLSITELQDPTLTFLSLIVYETSDYICPSCEIIKKILKKKNIEYKKVNFIDNLTVSTRFFEIKFPTIFYKNKDEFFRIPLELVEELTNDNLHEICTNEKFKIRKIFSPNSLWSKINSGIFCFSFSKYLLIKEYMKAVPMWVVLLVAFLLFLYVFYTTKPENKKESAKSEEKTKDD
ncbi:hypothetical protein CDIK_0921 [Cucumispora dikerogammari]|nr:hypothetical protein CDIK_0921 [Cucumispora dikerogammari]